MEGLHKYSMVRKEINLDIILESLKEAWEKLRDSSRFIENNKNNNRYR